MMRISNQWIVNSFMKVLNRNHEELSKTQVQISSGKQITTPSENPVNNALAMQHKTELVEHDQYIKNISRATEWLDGTDTTLTSLESALQRARELAVQGANDTNVQADRDAIAAEIDQLLQHVIELGNTDIGGDFIFAGHDVKTKPFTTTTGQAPYTMKDVVTYSQGNGRTDLNVTNILDVLYHGDKNKIATEIEKGVILSKNVSGSEVFYQNGPTTPQPSFGYRASPVTPMLQVGNLNNGKGMQSGSIVLSDSNGIDTWVDLSFSKRLEDVLYSINSTRSFKAMINEVPTDTAVALGIAQRVGQANTIEGQPILWAANSAQDFGTSSTMLELGVPPGFLSINTRDGKNRRVSIAETDTVQQVIDSINALDGGFAVTASFDPIGNHLTLRDLTAGTSDFSIESKRNELRIQDLPSHTAGDLGILNAPVAGVIYSNSMIETAGTPLSQLNGGLGVEKGFIDLTYTDGLTNTTVQVDLRSAKTLNDVVTAINGSDPNLNASWNPVSKRLEIQGQPGFSIVGIAEVDGGNSVSVREATTVARHLGILKSELSGNTIFGDTLAAGAGAATLLSTLVPPPETKPFILRGADGSPTEIKLQGYSYQNVVNGISNTVSVPAAQTIQDVIDRINGTNKFQASWDPTQSRLVVMDKSGTVGKGITVEEATNTARDLGFVGSPTFYRSDAAPATQPATVSDVIVGAPIMVKSLPTLMGSLDLNPAVEGTTELSALNAGRTMDPGVHLGSIRIHDKAYKANIPGHSAVIDLRGAKTIQDVLDRINNPNNGLYLEAKINAKRNGIELVDKNNGATGRIEIVDIDSTTAQDLGFAIGKNTTVDTRLVGGDIDPAVTEFTLVTSLRVNEGGVPMGKVYVQSGEFSGEIDLTGAGTVGDILKRFSDSDPRGNLTAWIDPDGRRINLTNTKGQAFIKVRDLGKPQEAAASGLGLGGSKGIFETLQDLRDSLFRNDAKAISEQSIKNISDDLERVLKYHAEIGVRTNRMQAAKEKQENLTLHINNLLDVVENVDMTEAITRMTQLQTAFQAALQTGSRVLQTTLVDFLR